MAIALSWDPLGTPLAPLGDLLGPPEAARVGPSAGPGGGLGGLLGGFENQVTESRYLDTTLGRRGAVLGLSLALL